MWPIDSISHLWSGSTLLRVDVRTVCGRIIILNTYRDSWINIGIKAWIINCIQVEEWDVITYPCPSFSGGFVSPSLGHGWVAASHIQLWVRLLNACPDFNETMLFYIKMAPETRRYVKQNRIGLKLSYRITLLLRPRQNGRHFTHDILKCIFLNKNAWISIEISLKFVPMGPLNNIPPLHGLDTGLARHRRQAIV